MGGRPVGVGMSADVLEKPAQQQPQAPALTQRCRECRVVALVPHVVKGRQSTDSHRPKRRAQKRCRRAPGPAGPAARAAAPAEKRGASPSLHFYHSHQARSVLCRRARTRPVPNGKPDYRAVPETLVRGGSVRLRLTLSRTTSKRCGRELCYYREPLLRSDAEACRSPSCT